MVAASILQGVGNPTLLCILGSRMFFNLREAVEHGVNEGTNWSSHAMSGIEFKEPEVAEERYESFVIETRTH